MRMRVFSVALCALAGLACSVDAAVYNLASDWSDLTNPNGVWAYREGANALPHVASWQSALGGFTAAQQGWARSENGTDRIPFWYKSSGLENFAHDYVTGDVVVHTQDNINGIGQGPGNVAWTNPGGLPAATITGGVWMGRDIGRSDHWALFKNTTLLTEGDIASGDAFSRAVPFNFAAGTGGAAAVTNIPIATGDKLELRLTQTSVAGGDFVGVNLIVTTVPEPAGVAIGSAVFLLGLSRRRRRSR